MRYPARETAIKHERILDEAARAYRQKGFSGASVQEIMKATGLTHGPFYNHFASKDALVVATLDYISKGALELIEGFPRTTEGKAGFVTSYLSAEHRDSAGEGCLMAALGAEVSREPIYRPAFTRHFSSVLQRMIERFTWSSEVRKRREAMMMVAGMVGAIVLARAVDDEALSAEILHEVASGLTGERRFEGLQ